MSNIVELYNEFKSDREKQEYIAAQHTTITHLQQENIKLQTEIEHLKTLLVNSTQLISSEPTVERFILSPEEALIERQIELIQSRGLDRELTLEDTKKLDLLLKNKHLSKDRGDVVQGEHKKVDRKNLSSQELIQIALKKKDYEPSS